MHRLALVLISIVSVACASAPASLSTADRARLSELAEPVGTHVYDGSVVPMGADAPAFRYERWVRDEGASTQSTHATYDASGALVVVQRASHDEQYRLRRFEELHDQTGAVNTVEVDDDGSLHFTRRRGGQLETASEGPGAPVVVGPTLFGFVRRHLDQLTKGEVIEVRFAAADRGKSYAFELSCANADGSVVRFAPKSALVRLAIAPMFITFEGAGLLRYEGRVPPRLDGDAFDARVDYTMLTERYR